MPAAYDWQDRWSRRGGALSLPINLALITVSLDTALSSQEQLSERNFVQAIRETAATGPFLRLSERFAIQTFLEILTVGAFLQSSE